MSKLINYHIQYQLPDSAPEWINIKASSKQSAEEILEVTVAKLLVNDANLSLVEAVELSDGLSILEIQ